MIVSTAVITGGGSGIGAMIAEAFVRNGAKVYIASRKEKQLQQVNITCVSVLDHEHLICKC